ncbi:tRNAHis guanylyltransferase [Wolfiporia cocos MD-104 SS10]|uniref:tRNA(His) guanylyltransferase n=1 Tax=Wolfiporia cocos (strain MD-104) TaxID=742152 RepID=A0A2H3JKX5_WOLCO|nr:tRNAHis guanylyltransferase [Wolfiporia cocos MD-104 SS10]
MTGSRYEYVKNFELPDPILPGTFMVLRIDGRAFHRLSSEHGFVKPNDERALELMDHAARDVMNEFKDIVLAFGESDEYSFLFRKSTSLYNRRHSKILTTVTSLFTSSYVYNWSRYLPNIALKYPPTFDGRIVVYPSPKEVRDYFAWRQADTHINNLYNAVFWALVQQGGETTANAHSILRGTVSSQKHEILHSRFGINYNSISARFRKGSVFVRERVQPVSVVPLEGYSGQNKAYKDVSDRATSEGILLPQKGKKVKLRFTVLLYHCDIIGDVFWDQRPNILQE